MKKFLLIFITCIIFFVNYKNVEASEYMELKAKSIDILDSLPIEETYSYEETIKILEKYNYGDNYIRDFKNEYAKLNSSSSIRYQIFTFESEKIDQGIFRYNLTPKIWVGLEYSGSPSPNRIVSLKAADISTSEGYGNKKCVFNGSIEYNLISGREFQMLINGDVYKNGNLNVNLGIEISFGSAKSYFIVNNGSGFIQDVYFQRDYYSAGLSE